VKKSIWLAIIGAAALTGCQNEVMQEREYVPAPREDVEPAKPVVDNRAAERQDVEPIRQQQQQDTPPSVQELPVMKEQFGNETAKESDPVIAKPDKKGGKKAGRKGGKKGARGSRKSVGAPAAGAGEYVVRSGDTPEKIARRHHVRLSDLMEANNLTEESAKRLRIGQKLTIPARKGGAKGAQSSKGTKETGSGKRIAGAAPAENPGEYIVRSGDTPEKIARRHHVRVSDLMAANNFSEEDAKKLRIGQKIVIPEKGAAARKSTAPAGSGETRTQTASPGQSKGRDLDDESAGGAAAPTAPAAAPAQLNRIEIENGYLVEVPRDMTVAEFAKLNGISEDELRRLNPDIPEEMLKKDTAYAVPKN